MSEIGPNPEVEQAIIQSLRRLPRPFFSHRQHRLEDISRRLMGDL
jgi:hypothetical protein